MKNILLKLKESPVLKSIGSVFLHTLVGLSPVLVLWLSAVFFHSNNWDFEKVLMEGFILIFCLTLVFTSNMDFQLFNNGKGNLYPIVYCFLVIAVYFMIVYGSPNAEKINILPIGIATLAFLGIALIISSVASVPKFRKLAQIKTMESNLSAAEKKHLTGTKKMKIDRAQKEQRKINNPGT